MKNLRVREKLLANWGLKLVSLTVAFILWFVVASTQDPVDDKTLYNIKVNMINTHVLEEKGMVYEVLNGTDVLKSVTVEAPKSVRDAIVAGDIVAEANFEYLTHSDTVPIEFSCPKYAGKVGDISANNASVKLSIEDEVVKYLDIKSNVIGEVADDFMIGRITLDQNRLEISGPASKVAQIRKAVVDVNVADVANDISTKGNIYLLDSDGNELNYESIQKNVDSVRVEVEILGIKEVFVEYSVSGEVAEGYKVASNVTSNVKRVRIAGDSTLISTVNKIVVPAEEMDITGATETVKRTLNLRDYLPQGVVFADEDFDSKAVVSVMVEAVQEKTLNVPAKNIQFTKLPEAMKASAMDEEVELIVSGLKKDIDSLNEETIIGTIEVTTWMEERGINKLNPGTYKMPVRFTLGEGQEQVAEVVANVKVELAN